ncbi:MAG: hypothetical protein IJ719_03040 [Clostridia bacterium]|nr:hypothetical protein [Clostridia bacterium]
MLEAESFKSLSSSVKFFHRSAFARIFLYSKILVETIIVVYDAARLVVADSVNFDTHAESEGRR